MSSPLERPPFTVAVIEDDPAVLTLLREVFETNGFSVEPFTHPADALTSIRNAPPSVIVLDWHLPELSGWGVIEQLRRELERLPPILVLTGDVRLRELPGICTVLRKPVSLAHLVECVRALANDSTRRPARTA